MYSSSKQSPSSFGGGRDGFKSGSGEKRKERPSANETCMSNVYLGCFHAEVVLGNVGKVHTRQEYVSVRENKWNFISDGDFSASLQTLGDYQSENFSIDILQEMCSIPTNQDLIIAETSNPGERRFCLLRHRFSEIFRAPLSADLIQIQITIAEEQEKTVENFLFDYISAEMMKGAQTYIKDYGKQIASNNYSNKSNNSSMYNYNSSSSNNSNNNSYLDAQNKRLIEQTDTYLMNKFRAIMNEFEGNAMTANCIVQVYLKPAFFNKKSTIPKDIIEKAVNSTSTVPLSQQIQLLTKDSLYLVFDLLRLNKNNNATNNNNNCQSGENIRNQAEKRVADLKKKIPFLSRLYEIKQLNKYIDTRKRIRLFDDDVEVCEDSTSKKNIMNLRDIDYFVDPNAFSKLIAVKQQSEEKPPAAPAATSNDSGFQSASVLFKANSVTDTAAALTSNDQVKNTNTTNNPLSTSIKPSSSKPFKSLNYFDDDDDSEEDNDTFDDCDGETAQINKRKGNSNLSSVDKESNDMNSSMRSTTRTMQQASETICDEYDDLGEDEDLIRQQMERCNLNRNNDGSSSSSDDDDDEADNIQEGKYFRRTETPSQMLPSRQLKEYQKQGLTWMLFREQKITRKALFDDGVEELQAAQGEGFDMYALPGGEEIFFNASTGIAQNEFKIEEERLPVCGGILADQMGLGKTIMATSLILASKYMDYKNNPQQMQNDNSSPTEKSSSNDDQRNNNNNKESDANDNQKGNEKRNAGEIVNEDQAQVTAAKFFLTGETWADTETSKQQQRLQSGQQNEKQQRNGSMQSFFEKKGSQMNLISNPQIIAAAQQSLTTTLIVVPKSLVRQWFNEIRSSIKPTYALNVLVYDKSLAFNANRMLFSGKDVVITTYGVLTQEFRCVKKKGQNEGNLLKQNWLRVILDEAHNIRNRLTLVAQACCNLKVKYRWCLTGTPLQNKLDDLFSYFQFMNVPEVSDWKWWKKHISTKSGGKNASNKMNKQSEDQQSGYMNYSINNNNNNNNQKKASKEPDEQAYAFVRAILNTVMLRRTKRTKDSSGRRILKLPKKEVIIEKIRFHPLEAQLYTAYFKQQQELFERLLADMQNGSNVKIQSKVLVMINSLRMMCNSFEMLKIFANRTEKELIRIVEDMGSNLNLNNNNNNNNIVDNDINRMLEKKISSDRYDSNEQKPFSSDDDNDEGEEQGGSGESQQYRLAKTERVLQLISRIQAREEKVVLFTQWHASITRFEGLFAQKNIGYCLLHGKMSIKERAIQINEFTINKDKTVMILSLMAGCVGLNLTCANNVIMMDPWWNGQIEQQAIDRIYRIGQMKDIKVYRCAIEHENSIDVRVLELQESKEQIFSKVLSAASKDEKSTMQQNLSIEDFKFFFGITAKEKAEREKALREQAEKDEAKANNQERKKREFFEKMKQKRRNQEKKQRKQQNEYVRKQNQREADDDDDDFVERDDEDDYGGFDDDYDDRNDYNSRYAYGNRNDEAEEAEEDDDEEDDDSFNAIYESQFRGNQIRKKFKPRF